MPRQTWIANAIRNEVRAVGLNVQVIEEPGWKTRGHVSFNPKGVLVHHTATPGRTNYGTRSVLIRGHGNLPGPLCQVGLARNGDIYIVAAGRANHAGMGGWNQLAGNTSVFGIEAENSGASNDPWPAVQMTSYYVLVAALLKGIKRDHTWVGGHKEWAPTRKVDPSFSMPAFRSSVRDALRRVVPLGDEYPLTTGSNGPNVKTWQSSLVRWRESVGCSADGCPKGVPLRIDGVFGPHTARETARFMGWATRRIPGVSLVPADVANPRVGQNTLRAMEGARAALTTPMKKEDPLSRISDERVGALNALAGALLSENVEPIEIRRLVRFWRAFEKSGLELTDLDTLYGFVEAVRRAGSSGLGYFHLVKDFQDRRDSGFLGHQGDLVELANTIDEMNSSPRGLVRYAVALIRYRRAKGDHFPYESYMENRAHDEPDAQLPVEELTPHSS